MSRLSDLEHEIAEIDDRQAKAQVALGPYGHERDELAARLAAATLQDDALVLAGAEIRKRLLDAEISRLETAARHDAHARSELTTELSGQLSRRQLARRLVGDLRDVGLTHHRLRNLQIADLLSKLARARAVLSELGEPAAESILVEL